MLFAQEGIIDEGADVLISNGLSGVIILILVVFCVFMGRHILETSKTMVDEHKADRDMWQEKYEELTEAFRQDSVDQLEAMNQWNKDLIDAIREQSGKPSR